MTGGLQWIKWKLSYLREELQDQPATVANFAIVQKDRERTVVRRVDHYNLDVVKAYNIK